MSCYKRPSTLAYFCRSDETGRSSRKQKKTTSERRLSPDGEDPHPAHFERLLKTLKAMVKTVERRESEFASHLVAYRTASTAAALTQRSALLDGFRKNTLKQAAWTTDGTQRLCDSCFLSGGIAPHGMLAASAFTLSQRYTQLPHLQPAPPTLQQF